MKTHIKKGDTVQVMSGDSKGKSGRIVSIDKEKYRAVVEGINMITKHNKPSATSPQGGIVKREAPMHISKLMLIDPKSKKPSRIGRKKDEAGKSVRYFKKSGELVKELVK
jgi:large subunit ribosomal protein L24